jgi:hypothetical protein
MSILKLIEPLNYGSPISESLQTLIQSKVITLFNQACSINNPVMDYEFEPIVSGVNSLDTLFKYAVVEIICKEDHIAVRFHLRDEHTKGIVPVGSQTLVIITDVDMVYKSATFKSHFMFGKPKLEGNLSIDRSVDYHFNMTTSLSYAILSYGFEITGFNLKYEALPKSYLSDDNNFYTPFLKMIAYCFNKPDVFYSVFEEYPSHENMLNCQNAFKQFLRNYNNDYKRGKKLLKSKIALLDMQAI